MKKFCILFLLLAIFVALTVLVSCGGNQNENSCDTQNSQIQDSIDRENTDRDTDTNDNIDTNTDDNINTDTNDNIDTDSDKADDSNVADDEIQENYTEGLDFYPLDDGTLAIECNSDIIKYLTKIVIPAKHNGKIVSKIGENAFEDFTNIRTIVIPDSITEICYSAFSGCSNLSNIVIPNSVASIGDYTFRNCYNLTNIEIPNSVTSIGHDAFRNCYNLTSIEIPNSVTSIGDGAFSGCSNLTYNEFDNGLYLGDTNNPYVVLVKAKDKTITSYTINEQTKLIGYSAFEDCSNLTSIVIPNSVTSIGYSAFSACAKLTIYCEAESKPSGWHSNWNNYNRPVEWGYKG